MYNTKLAAACLLGFTVSAQAGNQINFGRDVVFRPNVTQRVASTNGAIPFLSPTAVATKLTAVTRYNICWGGNFTSFKASFNNFYLAQGVSTTPRDAGNATQPLIINKWSLEYSTTGLIVPGAFAGSANVTLSAGEVDHRADSIAATSFGLTQFPRNDCNWWIHVCWSITTGGGQDGIWIVGNATHGTTGAYTYFYNPATGSNSTVCDNAVATGGAITQPAGSNSYEFGYGPSMLVGTLAGPDVYPAAIGIGDSIYVYNADIPPWGSGPAVLSRALTNSGTCDSTNPCIAALKFAAGGARLSQYAVNPNLATILNTGLFNLFQIEGGVNDIVLGATSTSLLASLDAIVGTGRGAGIKKIVGTYILPKTDSCWQSGACTCVSSPGLGVDPCGTQTGDTSCAGADQCYKTEAGQYYYSGHEPSGVASQYNAALSTKLGTGLQGILYADTIRGTNTLKWKVNGSPFLTTGYETGTCGGGACDTGGVHPNTTGHGLLGAENRTKLLSFTFP